MKSKKWFLIIGVPVIMLVLAFALKVCYIEIDGFGQIEFWYLINKDEYQQLYIKKHSLAKFSKLKIGMEFDEVFKLVGKPTGADGNAITWFFFELNGYWHIEVRFSSKGLCDIRIASYPNGRIFKLEQVEIEKDTYQKLATKPKHSLAKFTKLEMGMIPDEVIALVGKPTGADGNGILWYRYNIDTGWYIELLFFNGKLSDMSIVDFTNNWVFELEQEDYITTLPCPRAVARTNDSRGSGTFIDDRDGKTYRTVTVGTLTWMAENLNFVMDSSVCYDNADSNCTKYGRLYNLDDAMKACPAGWRLSSDEDWLKLALAVAGKCDRIHWKTAAKKLKTTTDWDKNGTDEIGFSALPGGIRYSGIFSASGGYGSWWSATEGDASSANVWEIASGLGRENSHNARQISVRCVQDVRP